MLTSRGCEASSDWELPNIITWVGGDVWEGKRYHFLESIKSTDRMGDARLVETSQNCYYLMVQITFLHAPTSSEFCVKTLNSPGMADALHILLAYDS